MTINHHNTFITTLFLILITTTQLGCASKNQIADLTLNSNNYNQTFDSTKNTLRNAGYQLDRVDRRFGIITSQPVVAGSILEPWRDITATPEQALDSTLNFEHRIIRIAFIPASGTSASTQSTNTSPPQNPALAQIQPTTAQANTDLSTYTGTIRLDVQAIIERAHQPGRQIESTSLRRSSYTIDPSLAERGIPRKFWEVVARDPYQEQYLMKKIVKQSQGTLVVELINQNTK